MRAKRLADEAEAYLIHEASKLALILGTIFIVFCMMLRVGIY